MEPIGEKEKWVKENNRADVEAQKVQKVGVVTPIMKELWGRWQLPPVGGAS